MNPNENVTISAPVQHSEPPRRSRVLHPEHRLDLAKSGLKEASIEELGIQTIVPREIDKHLGFSNLRIESVLCFPYPGVFDPTGIPFCRDKLFPPLKDENGHSIRYIQRKGTNPHLYIPPYAQAILTDPTKKLYITGGEKKAAKACQEGLPCIGLGTVASAVVAAR